jgi:hypothetical protein
MKTTSFKSEDEFKQKLDAVAQYKGINTSAYIKMKLTAGMRDDLSEITVNGMTVAEELEILRSHAEDPMYGPFETVDELMIALNKDV